MVRIKTAFDAIKKQHFELRQIADKNYKSSKKSKLRYFAGTAYLTTLEIINISGGRSPNKIFQEVYPKS